ncbi:cytochrome P450 [Mycena maculata]|uniref:Cytochrome P450 n=1 Tax=Mycena maculata TaxID=230809 RepID=A0AAD7HH15_9AGAR|nr:cytochrome P450 [Mycena maculata]
MPGLTPRCFDFRSTIVLAVTVAAIVQYFRKCRTPPLPPGPRGLPFVGNIFDVPSRDHWLRFSALGEAWGDISSLTAFGQTLIIVNSLKVAEDLLEVHGANFSDRPVVPMGGELVGFKHTLSLSQYGERVRKERKLFHQLFGSQHAISRFLPLISPEIHKLLQSILLNPTEVGREIKRTTGGIALRIAYGYQIIPGPDPHLDMFETAVSNFSAATKPAAFLVDLVPALRYWPEWLPGGGFQTTAKIWSKQLHETVGTIYESVRSDVAKGMAEPSFTSTLLEENTHEEYLIKWAAASIQAGGSDTAASQLQAFLVAMSLYPEVQAAAQKELDAIVGDRIPEISDRSRLPYVNALCKEVLRWHVAAPTGIPHRTRADFIYSRDDYNPLLIPKESLIIPNIWKMTHDPERYANPMIFDPTRFIATDGKPAEEDPARICFGFGRRICPGKLLADTTVFMACSAILAVFDVSKARENGVPVEPSVGQTTGTVSWPLPFKCSVEPRNARALALIHG